MIRLVFVLITFHFACSERHVRPIYEYRYETQDVMQSDASSFPVHGYHNVRSNYYPDLEFDRYPSDLFRPNYRRFDHRPYVDYYRGGPSHRLGYYNRVGDSNQYSEGGKTYKDDNYEKLYGHRGEHSVADQAGYNHGNVNTKNDKGATGYYNEEIGKKKSTEDGKSYHGNEHISKEGQQSGQQKQKASHKKGHVVKGFKKSHHKDEDSKTEEYYDESHDEGGNYKFGEGSGSYGTSAASAYKGGHDKEDYNELEKKDDAHYDSKHYVSNTDGDQGHYNKNKQFNKGETYDLRNGVDQHSLTGHKEVSKVYNEAPYHVPFFPLHD